MNYSDIALNADQIAALKKSWRKTGWRIKVLKPSGKKTPDSNTTNIVKIDSDQPGNYYPLNTAGSRYKKLIHDAKKNRTFILHHEDINEGSDAIVSIVNHELGAAHEDFIEKINITTSAGWPAAYYGDVAHDIAYDPVSQQLAIAVTGAGSPDVGPPALFMIDCRKYLPELMSNVCNRLEPNPDYLSCTIWAGNTTVVGVYPGAVLFVRFYDSRWWTWTYVTHVAAGNNDHLWQLGFFFSASSYTVVAQYGFAPDWNGVNGKGETWAAGVSFPTQSRWYPQGKNESGAPGTPTDYIDGYWCDPAAAFAGVTSFDVVPGGADGYILIGTTPYHGDLCINEFGIEGFLFRINIETLLANYADPAPVATGSWTKPAVYDPETGYYNVLASVETDMLDTTSIRGYCRVYMEQDHTGAAAGGNYGDRFRVQSRFGTVNIGYGFNSAGQQRWHVATFCDAEMIKIGLVQGGDQRTSPFTLAWNYCVYPLIPGLEECIGIHSADPIVQATDTDRPMTAVWTPPECGAGWEDDPCPCSVSWNLARYLYPGGKWTQIRKGIVYNAAANKYVFPVLNELSPPWYWPVSNSGLGLWTHDGTALTRLTAAETALDYDFIGAMAQIDDAGEYALLASNDVGEDNLSIQFFRTADNSFLADKFTAELIRTDSAATGVWWDPDSNAVGFCTGGMNSPSGEIWFWYPMTTAGGRTRDPRVWWDGANPDVTIGDGDAAGAIGQLAAFFNPAWKQTKGTSSYSFSFDAEGMDYLPWIESRFNENPDFPGTFAGTFEDGARLIVERGIWDGGEWAWIREGQTFVVLTAADAESGFASINVSSQGPISLLVTRATYEGFHKPDEEIYSEVDLKKEANEDGSCVCYYEEDGKIVADWRRRPEPVVLVDGVRTMGFNLDLNNGMVTFETKPTGTVTASFSAYVPGTNEAEDIIKCILTYPQELGGCGLDESYITRTIEGATLTTEDHLTYSFLKNNLVPSDPSNAIYRDGAPAPGGFTWDERNGSVTFSSSQIGHLITGDCVYYTIQKSGATLRPLRFHPRIQQSSIDAINEVCRRVAPNYCFREGRDGKLECDFFTQKAEGGEDLAIEDEDIVLTSLESNPAYEGLATRALSFGKAELEELPNFCLGKTVIDDWSVTAAAEGWGRGWHDGTVVERVVDGDPATGATSGYGEWGDEGDGKTYDVQAYLIAHAEEGVPCLTADMGEPREVATIIIARPSQVSTEGEVAGAVQAMSLWVSEDASDFIRIVETFELPPGRNVRFNVDSDFEHVKLFRYIRVNLHSLGLYRWGSGKTHSQMGISEIQCYPNEVIMGEARLQAENPGEPLYDHTGLLDKYGVITHVARNGSHDQTLSSQNKADEDARFTLEEIVRLVSRVTIRSPWLPGIPAFSTLRIVNSALGIDKTFFVEEHSASPDGDIYMGNTLP